MYVAITYVGRTPGKKVSIEGRVYEFEWQKSIGIGTKEDEVKFEHAKKLSRWKDKRGKKMFRLE